MSSQILLVSRFCLLGFNPPPVDHPYSSASVLLHFSLGTILLTELSDFSHAFMWLGISAGMWRGLHASSRKNAHGALLDADLTVELFQALLFCLPADASATCADEMDRATEGATSTTVQR